ncbi:MAG TPA: hypothetical protein ENH10_07550 [Bacteroidetes bacterium]|nr:MgtE intracellular N domain protein [bacterium BMS3Bbin04]HDO65868.1 hypothetical protein [Bacteroidota bacterium]HEX04993.1 hypothetical protein [Bacteroidota bacterium]
MSKKQILILAGVFVLGYVISLGATFFMLKTDQGTDLADSLAVIDSLEQAARESDLDLTLDISVAYLSEQQLSLSETDTTLSPAQAEVTRQDQARTIELADSIAATITEPMREEMQLAVDTAEQAEEKVASLEDLLAMVSADADSIDQANAKRLAKIIENMRPDDAAAVMNNLGSYTTARLLVTMRQRQAAKILAAMPSDTAAEVARYLSQAYQKSSI